MNIIMGINKHIYQCFFLLTALVSCSNEVDFGTYMRYISDQDNGLVKEKEISGLLYKAKYLPIDYLVYNDLNKNTTNDEKPNKENLLKSYKNSLCFMLTMGPDENEEFDVTMLGVKNYDEYAQQMEVLNFSMAEYISLKVGDKVLKPDIVQMENTYGLEKQRNFMISFQIKDNATDKFIKSNDVKLVYNDELFGTGINLFSFKKSDLQKLPILKY